MIQRMNASECVSDTYPQVVVVVAKIPSRGMCTNNMETLYNMYVTDTVWRGVAGVSKSRLIPALGEEDTLKVAEALLLDS
jgi:hypothetical protein